MEYGKYKLTNDKYGNLEVEDTASGELDFFDKGSIANDFIRFMLSLED